MPNGYASEIKVSYHFCDLNDGKIELAKRADRFTIFLADNNGASKEEQVSIALSSVFKATVPKRGHCEKSGRILYSGDEVEVKEVSKDVYKIVYKNLDSLSVIDKVMDEIRKKGVVAHHAYKPAGDDYTVYYISDRIAIEFKSESSTMARRELCKTFKLSIPETELSKDRIIARVTTDSGENPVKIANKIALQEIITSAEPSLIYRINKSGTAIQGNPFKPKDEFFDEQWYMEVRNANSKVKKDAGINVMEAWQLLKGGGDEDVVIAVMDQGFFVLHPDFENSLVPKAVYDQFDFITPQTPFLKPISDMGFADHGTKCAGLAIASNNEIGMVGIAYDCQFLPVRFPDSDVTARLVECFEKVGEMADVISCSWSVVPANVNADSVSEVLTRLAKSGGRRKKGCVICFSAGNYNAPLDEKVTNPFNFFDSMGRPQIAEVNHIKNPYASSPGVIAVAASTSLNKKAAYSNYGKEISVCAPGGNYLLEKGVLDFEPPGIFTTATRGNVAENYTDKFIGTSSAAPLVAGLAALVISANKNLTARMIKSVLEITADKIGDGDPEIDQSAGRYTDKQNGRHSIWFGYGKINAGRAVKLALALNEFDNINPGFDMSRQDHEKLKNEMATELEIFERTI